MNNFLNPPVENLTLDGFLYPLARSLLSLEFAENAEKNRARTLEDRLKIPAQRGSRCIRIETSGVRSRERISQLILVHRGLPTILLSDPFILAHYFLVRV
jgi:hypothetical protein